MKRSLSLKRESLSELASDELASVRGANLTPWVQTLPVEGCLLTGYSFPDC